MSKPVEEILDSVVEDLGGSRREGQVQMIELVSEALDSDGHLLVQAGTGTGKSIGYLAPAMEWSMASGERVIVSTATLALQRQIVLHDAPRVARAVTSVLGKTPRVGLLKGWNNYVCLRKATGGYPEEDALISRAAGEYGATATGEEVTRLREWAMSTDTGDRDDLVPGVSERAWRQVSVTKPECIGTKCPLRDSCFPLLARGAAEESDIVVTNHSMLGIQSAGTPVLPEASAFIVDEAHDLVDRVTSQLTSSISAPEVAGLARLLRREKILATDLGSGGGRDRDGARRSGRGTANPRGPRRSSRMPCWRCSVNFSRPTRTLRTCPERTKRTPPRSPWHVAGSKNSRMLWSGSCQMSGQAASWSPGFSTGLMIGPLSMWHR